MARVPIFATGKEGKSRHVSSQRLVNMFAEIADQPDRSIINLYPTPGLSAPFVDFGETPVRGWVRSADLFYAVHRGTFYEVNNSGIKTIRGLINTTLGQVSMAENGVQIMIVDGLNGWIWNNSTLVFAQITDVDFPAGADVCVYSDSFFLVNNPGTGQFNKSASFNGLSWAPLEFATAESAPDNLLSIFPHQGYLALFGENTTEGWQNVGGANFPYQRVSGAVIEWGIAAKNSIAKYDNSLMFLAKNRLGGSQVVVIENFLPRPVSGQDFQAELATYTTVADAVAFSYFDAGHSFYHISFPSVGKSWIYDLAGEAWAEVKSGGGRHRAELSISFLEKTLVSDYENGRVYNIGSQFDTDNGAIIEREVITKHLFDEYRTSISRLWLDIQQATGTSEVQDPRIVLTISRDGGNTFGPGVPGQMGRIGAYVARCFWSRLGRARDWVFKFRLTETARLVITGAFFNTDEE